MNSLRSANKVADQPSQNTTNSCQKCSIVKRPVLPWKVTWRYARRLNSCMNRYQIACIEFKTLASRTLVLHQTKNSQNRKFLLQVGQTVNKFHIWSRRVHRIQTRKHTGVICKPTSSYNKTTISLKRITHKDVRQTWGKSQKRARLEDQILPAKRPKTLCYTPLQAKTEKKSKGSLPRQKSIIKTARKSVNKALNRIMLINYTMVLSFKVLKTYKIC